MQKLPFDTTNINAGDIDALEETYKVLKQQFKIGLTEDHTFDPDKFDVFKNNEDINVGGTLLVNHPESGCYLIFAKVRSQIQNARGPSLDYYRYQVWALATLRNDFGRMMIRKETVVDKILNMVHPTEMCFKDDPTFTKKFNVIADDKQKATRAMTKAFRNALMEAMTDDLIMEIVNSSLIVGNTLPLDPKKTIGLAEFASKLSKVR